MLHRNAAQRALEKELALLQKREGRMETRALADKEGAWKAKLEEKVPEKVYTSLEQAFCKAFALVFEKGTGIIEKSYDRDALEKDYAVRDFAVQVKGDRRTLRRFPRENRGANAKNLLLSTVEGVGLGALGIGLPDIVLFVGMLLKGIYETALRYGFPYEGPAEQMWILRMMETSLTKGPLWAEKNQGVDAFLHQGLMEEPTKEALSQQIQATAQTFAMDMLVLKFIQGLPLVGALGGAANPVYYRRVLNYVQLKYHKRYLYQKKKGDGTMNEWILPQGEAAALMPGASYSLPGLFLYSKLIYQCLDQVQDKFGYAIPVRYLYGSPKVLWNCGRLIITDNHYTREEIYQELAGAKARGITPLLTFSAPVLSQEDLADPAGNAILAMADEVGGGVIVSTPLLRDYIRAKYPNIEVHASVIMTAFPEQRDEGYYASLAREYDRFVVHPDDNFRLDLLEKIPKDRAEIILNERCVYQCHQRKEHYLSIVEDQAALIQGDGELTHFLDRCPNVPDFKQHASKARNISLTAEEAVHLREMGFSLFKLQGRLDIPYVFFFDFLRYALENQLSFPAEYPVFSFSIRQYLKEKERNRQRQRNQEKI